MKKLSRREKLSLTCRWEDNVNLDLKKTLCDGKNCCFLNVFGGGIMLLIPLF